MTDNHQQPLHENVHMLGDILGETIAACEGRAFFEKVESMRQTAKAARQGDPQARLSMARAIAALDDTEKYKMTKAFTAFLQLANVAEKTHRIRRRRDQRRDGHLAQRASSEEMIVNLLKKGVKEKDIKKALVDVQMELVLTAHPTEVLLPDLIRGQRDLSRLLLEMDNPFTAPEDRERIINAIRAAILKQWRTQAIRMERPTPQDEARYGIELTTTILWDAVPQFFRELRGAFNRKIGSMVDIFPNPVRFASWMGGDRDGHPGVTADVTREVIDMSVAAARQMYLRECAILSRKLDFATEDKKLEKTLARCREHIAAIDALVRDDGTTRDRLMRRLETFKAFLQKNGLWTLVEFEYQNLIWRVRVFGLSLLKLDIRQASDVHARAMAAFIPGFAAMDTAARTAAILKRLGRRIKKPKRMPAEAREVMATLSVIADYPPEFFGPYIISMAENAADILSVQFLMQAAGLKTRMPVCPLFETPDSLAGAADVMASVYKIPAYRRHAGKRQDIMLGYSDSGKRGGYIQAAWEIYTLQEKLQTLGRRSGIETVFFHGRGGAIARGGGPAELTLAALPRPVGSRRIRITEQGEVINARYGLAGIAGRSMEMNLSAFMDAVFSDTPDIPAAWTQTLDRLAAASAADFRASVYDSADFMDHYTQLTPAREMSLLKIGSRPGSRKSGGGLESMRAIPWVFSWTQSRMLFPVWKGVAAALAAEDMAALSEMYRGWPFFKSVIDLIEIGVSVADPDIAQYYSDHLVDPSLRHKTKTYLAELDAVRVMLRRIKSDREVLDSRPVLQRSIALRTPYVDVLNVMQVDLLARHRAGKLGRMAEDALALTFSGISAGMHNTG